MFQIIVTFVISVALTAIFIPVLRKLKFGQEIRGIGPSWHQSKSGTPTMGGVAFVLAMLISALAFRITSPAFWFVLLGAFCYGLIGFIDDFIKVKFKRNLGLYAWQKFGLQLLASVGLVIYAVQSGLVFSDVYVPIYGKVVDFGVFYMPLCVLILLSAVNAVNLTDGVDGLVTSVTIIVLMFFWVLAGKAGMTLPTEIGIGALLGFLTFNRNPAKVFMGDTGSLFLGGLVALLAIVVGNPLILMVVGIIYLIETLSVIIQVISFKTRGKRVFLMSPIHHHYEQKGWSERKIVVIFTVVTIIACVVGAIV